MSISTTEHVSWVGWLRTRKRGPWEKVCQAATLGECSRLLGEIARRRGVRDRDCIMTGGGYPLAAGGPTDAAG
jgi:hypothetical protein